MASTSHSGATLDQQAADLPSSSLRPADSSPSVGALCSPTQSTRHITSGDRGKQAKPFNRKASMPEQPMNQTAFMFDHASSSQPVFLTARWSNLLMLNYACDPDLLKPLIPAGVELDDFDGMHLVSVVGFEFLNTKLLGVPIPGHRDFVEVNLRGYVRKKVNGHWRRGVFFIKEIVPRWAIAFVARQLYGERYIATAMSHTLKVNPAHGVVDHAAYQWRYDGCDHAVWADLSGDWSTPQPGDLTHFIVDHFWGYTPRRQRMRQGVSAKKASMPQTSSYRVEHPDWRVRFASSSGLDVDVTAVWGPGFGEPLNQSPVSAFLAEGSDVCVRFAEKLEKPSKL